MKRSVLLVDDDESSRLVLSVLLEDEGFQVDAVGSFAEAKARLLGGPGYDLALLDQHLGDGRGTDLLPFVRAQARGERGGKALLLSGSVDEAEALRAGFDAGVPKGVGFPDLIALVRRLLG